MTANVKKVTEIHESTVKQFSTADKYILDLLCKEGSYRVIPDERVGS